MTSAAKDTRSRPRESVASRLKSVSSVEDLHRLFSALARQPNSRWKRTQILHYLPTRFHARAEAYFDGELLRLPHDQPALPDPVDHIPLHDLLHRIRSHDPGDSTGGKPNPSIEDARANPMPGAREIGALPTYVGTGAGHEAIDGMIRALREEIAEVDLRTPKRYRLRDGRCIGGTAGRFTYQFIWSSEPDPHMPGTLLVDGKACHARVGTQAAGAELRFDIETEDYLGPTVIAADFLIDPTFLLVLAHQQLIHELKLRHMDAIERIDHLCASPGPAVSVAVPSVCVDRLNAEQTTAVRTGLGTARAYVWGPPGTGKTTTLGALVAALVTNGKRVLVVSPYNVAVDAAVLSAAQADFPRDGIVRIGRIGEEVRRAGLDLESRLEKFAATNGTLNEARQLLAALGARTGNDTLPPASVRACLDEMGAFVIAFGTSPRDPELKQVIDAIARIRQRFRDPEDVILRSATVVACTVALHIVLPLLRAQRFDHVIVDEASVLRPPEAVLLSLHTNAPVTFFGDPKQLPPIVISRSDVAKRWLGRNPFALAGIERPSDAVGACVLLEEQHRMAPPISALVSELFYEGRLRNGVRAPQSGQVTLVDTSLTAARATSRMVKMSTSKENQTHRAIVADVVRSLLRTDSDAGVLVVSPFVAQTRAYRREPATSRLSRGIRFETIHASQGSERDIVIIDLVLAGSLGGGGRSHMFDDERNPHIARLLNVALSRAKRRLVIVGHHDLLASAYSTGLLYRLWQVAASRGDVVQVPSNLRCRAGFDAVFASPTPTPPPPQGHTMPSTVTAAD